MIDFEYCAPTKILFGRGMESRAGEQVKAAGGTKALIHYGGKSAQASGLLDRVCNSVREAGLEYVLLGGVEPNPRISLARKGVELCRKEQVDFLLAVGGGSVVDSAKAIGFGLANQCDPWEIYQRETVPEACTPIGVILTIAAAGSEMSDSSVLTNEDGWLKRGFNSPLCRSRFSILNPELTFTLPPFQTACGCVDILMHTMERYFTIVENVELTDRLSEGLMKTVLRNTPIVLAKPDDYDARAEIMWAGSLSHNGLMSTGRTMDFATHQLEHELSGMFDVAHGAGLSALWGSWARYVLPAGVGRFAQFAVNVMGCPMDFLHPIKTALAGVEAMEAFYRSIGMPARIKELGIELTPEQIQELAHKCSFFGKREIGNFQKLNEQDMMEIYRMAQ